MEKKRLNMKILSITQSELQGNEYHVLSLYLKKIKQQAMTNVKLLAQVKIQLWPWLK